MASVTAVIDDDTAKPAEAPGAEVRETLGRDVLGRRLPPLKERLYPPMPKDFEGGWIATLAITAFAAILRFWNLGNPVKFVFDETYYAKDAYSLLKFGYARQFIDKPEGAADKAILAGNLDVFKDTPSLTVHPEVGKWMIAAGEHLFGMNTFGWRFMPALCRHADRAAGDPDRPPDDPLDPDRLHRRPAARRRRPALRDVAGRPARHLPGLLAGRRGLLPGRRPRLDPPPARRLARPPTARAARSAAGCCSGRGGSRPASASGSRSAPSGPRSG